MTQSLTIPKLPRLEPAQDYAWLRAKGLEHVQKLGSRLWTDYNVHDPGITLLELLCYALTDLGYRTGFSVPDLLAAPPGKKTDFSRQGFHTAREILTINPVTVRDFRKLLIDIEGVKNGWLSIDTGAGEGVHVYADCKKGVLQYLPETPAPLVVRGLYDVALEFDELERVGNLNSGKVFYNFAFNQGTSTASTALIELRLPSLVQLDADAPAYAALRSPASVLIAATATAAPVSVDFISGNKGDNRDVQSADQASALRGVLYVTVTVKFLKDASDLSSAVSLTLSDVPMRVWFSSDVARRNLVLSDLKRAIEDPSSSGLLGKYLALLHTADGVIAEARRRLSAARNLCEDWCGVRSVLVEDVAVCAEFELEPSADIEAVMAEAYYRIEQYFSPEIRFSSLQELLDAGTPVEQIFEGPKLINGFLDDAGVDATNLKATLYVSDIISLLMDIEGVKAVRNLSLAGYDQEGKQILPVQPWELAVTPGHQPRFYPQASKFLLFKNGLPFLPDQSELNDVLQVIKGRNAQPKFKAAELDLPIVPGTYQLLQDYFPLQYQLPLTYGVGFEGLPATASVARVAQAKQLRGYLLFFEQMLVDYLAQLANLSEYFAVDTSVDKTYFGRFIDKSLIRDVEELYAGLDTGGVQALLESSAETLDRRNRFLDHLLARFAESFSEYALMLYRSTNDKGAAEKQLVERKIAFLKDVPRMTHDRGKAFDYSAPADVCDPASENGAGLALRIERLLGLDPSDRVFVVEHVLLRPRRNLLDALLPICVTAGCDACGAPDPYSFRLTVVLAGEGGLYNQEIECRRFAENAIRAEIPAHIEAKICWVSKVQLGAFGGAWCAWLAARVQQPADPDAQSKALRDLVSVFNELKSVYPPAFLHDCADGNDENRVLLNRTVITSASRKVSKP
jgi:hypothetical protein